jgi:aminopeptidase N
MWMPCIDTISFECKWKFQLLVPKNCIALASGVLASIEESKTKKLFVYETQIVSPSSKVGIAIGDFLSLYNESDTRVQYLCCSFNDLTLIERHLVDNGIISDV